jgi:acetyl esterase/lipase
MTAPWAFLAVSVIGALFTASAVLRLRRISYFLVPYFFGAWLTGELAVHHIVWQAIASIVFIEMGALNAWPGVLGLAITLVSWTVLLAFQSRAGGAGAVFAEALRAGLDDGAHDAKAPVEKIPFRRIARPFKMRKHGVDRVRNIAYGPAGHRHTLDVYRPSDWSAPERQGLCPTLLQIHGGGWTIGKKDEQALPLMYHLAARGWVCVAANYRLSPRATFPDHLIDVKRALAWIKEHGPEYGADPDFVVVTGGSAGGHLAALVALTANDPEYQPDFASVDTTVQACVPFYGVYDFLDRFGHRGKQSMTPFLEKLVMKCSPVTARDAWDRASPIARVHADAPPFFLIHGTHDSLAFVEDTRRFVDALKAVSRQPVVYAELPGAQHAFDIFHSTRSAYAVEAVTRFVEGVYATFRARKDTDAAAPPARASTAG